MTYHDVSDHDFRNHVYGPCNAEMDERVDQAFKEEVWHALTAKVREYAIRYGWHAVLSELKDAHRKPEANVPDRFLAFHLAQFAASESWADTVAVIARAMAEERREVEGRR